MVTFLTVLHIFVCLFLILVVLLQAGKGGGMGIAFGGAGSQTVFGSSGAGNFLTRLTSITAAIFLVTSLWLAHYSSRQDSKRLQELASQRAAEKKSDDEKAAKLKADMEKIRAASAGTVSKDTSGAGTAPASGAGAGPTAPGGSPTPVVPSLQLKPPGTPSGTPSRTPSNDGTGPAPPGASKPTGAEPAANKPASTGLKKLPAAAPGVGDEGANPTVKRRKPAAAAPPPASGEATAPAAPAPAPAAPAE